MVEPTLTEDEQVEKIKSWWKDNGTSVIVGAVIGIAAVAGYNYWNSFKRTQAENASTYYEEMLVQQSLGENDAATALADQLMDEFASTPYGPKAALMAAKLSVERDDVDGAESNLRWALDNAKDAATKHTARLRLAYLLLSVDRMDDAASLLAVDDMGGFASQYHEISGDVFVAQSRYDEAQTAYESSLGELLDGSRHRQLLELKLNNLVNLKGGE